MFLKFRRHSRDQAPLIRLQSMRSRLMRMLHPYAYRGPLTKEDRAELIALVDKHGERYGIISEIMKREPLSLREAYHQFQPRFNHGKWSTTDEERFYGIMNRMGYVEGDEHRDIYWPEVSRQMHSRSVNSCIAKWYGQFGLQKRKVVWTPVVDAALVLAVREDGGEYAGEVEWRDVADSVMYIMRHAPAMKPARDESEAAAELVIAAAEVEEQEEQEEAAAAAAAGAGAGGGGSGGGSNVKASSSQSSGNATPVLQGCDCRFRLTALTRRAGLVHLQRDTQAVVDRLEVFLQRVHGKYGDVFQPVKSVLDATREDIVLTDSDSESEADSPGAGAGRGRDVAAVATPALVKEVPAPIAARKRSRSSSSLSCSSSGSSSSDSDSSSQGSSSSSSGATGKQAPPKAARGSNTSPAGKHMLRLDDDDSSSGSSSDNSSGSGSSSSSSSAEGPRPSALSSGESSADDDEDAGMDSDEAKLLQAARRTTAAGRNAASSKKAARAAKAAAVAAVRGGTILNDSDSD